LKISISNIAWDAREDIEISAILNSLGIDSIDIAPSKYFSDINKTTEEEVVKVKEWWLKKGINIVGMQSLLFGTKGLHLFGENSSVNKLERHLQKICKISSYLGAKKIVFGSPKNRDRGNLNDDEVKDKSVKFFRSLGEYASDNGIVVCLEPNPERYGANFMTTSKETIEIVRAIDHEAIKMQFDTGSLTINNESAEIILKDNADIIGHIHISEPDLLPIGDSDTDHELIFNSLVKYLPDAIVTIEMIATTKEKHIDSIERAIRYTSNIYEGNK